MKADWFKLGDVGIHGNGRFSFLEKKILEIAEVVEIWILGRGGMK